MSDAYVMKTCATCKFFEPSATHLGIDVGECGNYNVPVTLIILAPSQAARWGCILHESRLPAVDVPPTD